jgi:vacuolar-type H+-ATPase subunit E/Vma4
MDIQQKSTAISAIQSQERAIEITKNKIATRKELMSDAVESKQEWLDLESTKEEVKRLANKLQLSLQGDLAYGNQLEDLAQLKDKLKSQKETLSDLVVGYVLETKERQVEMNNQGDARDLIIKGSLGKKGKYQTNLFVDQP